MIDGAVQCGQAPLTRLLETDDAIDQVGEQDDGITLWAVAAQIDTTSEGVALGTSLRAEDSCLADGALVHGVLEEPLHDR